MPKTVVLEDDGIFILAAYYNGIAHAPGYPLYTLLAHFATYVPVGSIAARVHAFSALLGVVACLVLWFICLRLLSSRLLASTTTLVYAFSLTFWSQAIIAEVYTLNVLLFLLLVLFCLQLRERTEQAGLFCAACFTYGLALSNHWPLIILSTPLLVALVWPVIRRYTRHIPKGIACLCVGLLPYAWLVINSWREPVISFYGPIQSLSDFFYLLSREGYRSVDITGSAGLEDKLYFTGFFLEGLYLQFRPLGIFFIMLGFVRQWRDWPLSLSIGMLLGFIGSSLLLISLLGFDYDIAHQNLFRVYPVISYVIAAIWLSYGIKVLTEWLARDFSTYFDRDRTTALLCFLLGFSIFLANYPVNYRANDYMAHNYARVILSSLEPDAIFFTYGDVDTGPLGYMNLVENVRTDVTLYNGQGLVFHNRLFNPIRGGQEKKKTAIQKFIKNTDRPVYFSTNLAIDSGFEDYGLYAKVDRDLTHKQRRIILLREILQFMEIQFISGEPYDHWENMLYQLLQNEYCRIVASQVIYRNETEFENEDLLQLQSYCSGYYGKIALAELMLQKENPRFEFIYQLLMEAEGIQHQAIKKEDVANVYNLLARYHELRDEFELAEAMLQRSLSVWNNPENRAFRLAAKLRKTIEKKRRQLIRHRHKSLTNDVKK